MADFGHGYKPVLGGGYLFNIMMKNPCSGGPSLESVPIDDTSFRVTNSSRGRRRHLRHRSRVTTTRNTGDDQRWVLV